MVKLCTSKIYKSHLQGKHTSHSYSCFSILNYGGFYHEARQPFGSLLFFNEESLTPQQSQTYISNIPMASLILPLTGNIDCSLHTDTYSIDAEQIQFLKLETGNFYTIKNTLYNNPVSYLHIGIKENIKESVTDTIFLERMNTLSPLYDYTIHTSMKAYIGAFNCFAEDMYTLKQKDSGVFIYITSGIFKIKNRQLEQGDAFSIRDINDITFEALAPNSALILMELPLNSF